MQGGTPDSEERSPIDKSSQVVQGVGSQPPGLAARMKGPEAQDGAATRTCIDTSLHGRQVIELPLSFFIELQYQSASGVRPIKKVAAKVFIICLTECSCGVILH